MIKDISDHVDGEERSNSPSLKRRGSLLQGRRKIHREVGLCKMKPRISYQVSASLSFGIESSVGNVFMSSVNSCCRTGACEIVSGQCVTSQRGS